MDSATPQDEQTESVRFKPLRVQRSEALTTVERTAKLHDLQIDSIEEQQRPLTIDIRITVTGDPASIIAFANATGGSREHESWSSKVRRSVGRALEAVPWG